VQDRDGDRDAEELGGRDWGQGKSGICPDRGTVKREAEACKRPYCLPGRHPFGQDCCQLDNRRTVARSRIEWGVGVTEMPAPGAPEPLHADPDIADIGPHRDRREPLGAEIVGLKFSAAVRASVKVVEDPPVDGSDPFSDHIGHHRCDRDRSRHAKTCALECKLGSLYNDCLRNPPSGVSVTHQYSSIFHSKISTVK
jgi:hypothetical protein